jgi:ribosomal protein S11
LPDRPGPGKVADAAIEALAAVILEVDQRAQPTVLPRLTDRARRATRRILGS